jgi:lipopolysaccharide biosynthesis glycosyltransferase
VPSALAVAEPVAIFLCANRPYLPGTLVAVTSLLMRNPELAARAEIVLCADSATLPLATALLGPAVTALGARLAPLDAGALVGEAPLESRYGLFTGGHALAVEAYWRIYVARHLARERWHRYAIYLDSDVSAGPRFLDLLDQPMPPHACLLARPEVDRAEVRHAADKHGLPQGSYFNSGVLMLDLHHPETLPRLEAAIRIAETEPERLVFQDQCALNIAFAGASAPLDEAFNRFLAPDAPEAGLAEAFATAGVVHFLDRPKPWDPMHTGPTAQLWLEHWQAASAFVPAPALAAALAAAFR